MNFAIVAILNFSIVIALVIGMLRYTSISRTYHPFFFVVTAGFFSELLATISTWLFKTNAAEANIYSLIECFLWLWQFKRWGIGFPKKWMWQLLNGMLIALWVTETVIQGISNFDSLFFVVYSFVLTFFAINQINRLIVEEKMNLLRNAKFLICAGMIIFYPYSVLVNCFYLFHLEGRDWFLSHVYYILTYVNVFVNLLYALAMLWIPTRERFTLPSL